MDTLTQIILSVLGLIGVSGIITTFMTKKKELDFRRMEMKEKRYKSALLYMDAYFNPKNIKYLSSRQPDIDTSEDILEYLQAEYHEMLLYASKKVIFAVREFITSPSQENYLKTIIAMRKDLWGKSKSLQVETITLN